MTKRTQLLPHTTRISCPNQESTRKQSTPRNVDSIPKRQQNAREEIPLSPLSNQKLCDSACSCLCRC
jgi:hypothetical protein